MKVKDYTLTVIEGGVELRRFGGRFHIDNPIAIEAIEYLKNNRSAYRSQRTYDHLLGMYEEALSMLEESEEE